MRTIRNRRRNALKPIVYTFSMKSNGNDDAVPHARDGRTARPNAVGVMNPYGSFFKSICVQYNEIVTDVRTTSGRNEHGPGRRKKSRRVCGARPFRCKLVVIGEILRRINDFRSGQVRATYIFSRPFGARDGHANEIGRRSSVK